MGLERFLRNTFELMSTYACFYDLDLPPVLHLRHGRTQSSIFKDNSKDVVLLGPAGEPVVKYP